MVSLYASSYLSGATLLIAVVLLRTLLRRLRAHSIRHLPGPPSGSWLVGNILQVMFPKESAQYDIPWTREYGNVMYIKGAFGSDMLFVTDPKALQYMLNTCAYSFYKPSEVRAAIKLTLGKGIIWVEGDQHSRHRKIMNPAFSYSALRGFLPVFFNTAQKTVTRIKENISKDGQSSGVVDMSSWLAHTTLDIIGITAFDYHFDANDGGNGDKLSNAYQNLFADAFSDRSDWSVAFEMLWGLLPEWLITLTHYAPTARFRRLRSYMKASEEVAQALLSRQKASYLQGKEGSKDLMSLLIKANLSENPKSRLRDDEIMPQLTTLLLAGHETTATTMTWAIYELSKCPGVQRKLREEIKATRAHAAQRGDNELTIADLDTMKYLLAVIKETLRVHPIVGGFIRRVGRDDVIPLSTPHRTKTGEMVTSIPVSRGQRFYISMAAYNRHKFLWGEDADVWRPERFLEGVEKTHKTNLGVVSNISTFSSGIRGCIGWRFAMIEMQAVIIELLENLEFSPPPGNIEIIRCATGVMTPMVKDSPTRRTELPVMVTPISV